MSKKKDSSSARADRFAGVCGETASACFARNDGFFPQFQDQSGSVKPLPYRERRASEGGRYMGTMMGGTLLVGTSGYAYKPWKGSFYPDKLPDKEMLKFYATQLATVEINYSFYQMPKESVLQAWATNVPEGFQFALKANQRITHIQRLRNCDRTLKRFLEVASVLQEGNKLGPILVQLPPNFKFDAALLGEFLAMRPTAFRFAFEVRHVSWYTKETYELLRKFETALCLAETDDFTPPEVLTAGFVYVRLRKEEYAAKDLAAWRKKFDEWTKDGVDVFVYVKHEDAGKGPKYARALLGK